MERLSRQAFVWGIAIIAVHHSHRGSEEILGVDTHVSIDILLCIVTLPASYTRRRGQNSYRDHNMEPTRRIPAIT